MNSLSQYRTMAKKLVPIGLLILGFYTVLEILDANKPQPQERINKVRQSKVFYQKVRLASQQLEVYSQGQAKPKDKLQLKAQVEGKIIDIHPNYVAGGRFNKGETLISIDDSDYRLILVQRQAKVAQAESQLAKIQAQADSAQLELSELGREHASALAKGLPQLHHAKAELASSKALLAQAKLNLSRTNIVAPFSGIVAGESISIGQLVSRNTNLGDIFARDIMEIKLPLSGEQLRKLDLPLDYFANAADRRFEVELSANMGGELALWTGFIARTEAVIDSRTRTVQVVVEVENPYQRQDNHKHVLLSGLFVNAKIKGQIINDAAKLPRKVLRTNNQVWFVDEQEQLQIQDVEVINRANDEVILKGIIDDARIITSSIPIPTVGMKVKAINEQRVAIANSEVLNQQQQLKPKIFTKRHRQKDSKIREKSIGKQLSKGKLTGGGG